MALYIEDSTGKRVKISGGGTPGKDGKSAYEAAVENGYSGTEEEFNSALAGVGVKPVMVVNVTYDASNPGTGYASNKTAEEIKEAFDAGYAIYAVIYGAQSRNGIPDGVCLNLSWVLDTTATFEGNFMQTLCILIVAGSAGTVLDTYDLVTDLTGSKGQIVGFNSSGRPVAQDLSAPVKSYTVTLISDGWVYTTAGPPPVSEGDPSRTTNQQIVSVSSIVADETAQQITAMPAAASQAAYYAAGVYASAQSAGSLIFTCGTVPTEDLTVYVTVMEVAAG